MLNQKSDIVELLDYGSRVSPEGLIGCWPFIEGSGNKVFDLSGNGNVIDLTTGVIWDGGNLSFSGAVDAACTGAVNLPTSKGTMIARVKFDVAPGTRDEGIFCLSDGVDPDNAIFLNFAAGDLIYLYVRASDVGANVMSHASISDHISINTFYTLAITWDTINDKYNFYIDGVLIEAGTGVVGNPATINRIDLGRYANGDKDMDGDMEYFHAFNCVLSAFEIVLLYREPLIMVHRRRRMIAFEEPGVAGVYHGRGIYRGVMRGMVA